MGMMDKLRGRATKAKHQAQHVADKQSDKIGSGLDKAGEMVGRRTGHRYDAQIDKGVAKAKERLSKDDADPNEAPPAHDPRSAEERDGPA